MTIHPALPSVVAAGLGACAGTVLGFAYFSALHRAVERFVKRGGGYALAGGSAARLAAAVAGLAAVAELGAAALLAALLGFLAARALWLSRYRAGRAARAPGSGR